MFKELEKIEIPSWLKVEKFKFDIKSVLKDSLFYPCGKMDASPIKDLIEYSYSFVYSDHRVTEDRFNKRLSDPGFKGYHIIHDESVWMNSDTSKLKIRWLILETNSSSLYPKDPLRFSLVYVFGDSLEAYKELYLSNDSKPKIFYIREKDRTQLNVPKVEQNFSDSVFYHPELYPEYIIAVERNPIHGLNKNPIWKEFCYGMGIYTIKDKVQKLWKYSVDPMKNPHPIEFKKEYLEKSKAEFQTYLDYINLPIPVDYLKENELDKEGDPILYYPGAGTDWEPIFTFGPDSNINNFVYVDYWITKDEVLISLNDNSSLEVLEVKDLEPQNFGKRNWRKFWPRDTIIPREEGMNDQFRVSKESGKLFACKIRLKLTSNKEINLYYIHADGIETFKVLNEYGWKFRVLTIELHWVGSYFGKGGAMEDYNFLYNPVPYIYFNNRNAIYEGYEQITAFADRTKHNSDRALFKRVEISEDSDLVQRSKSILRRIEERQERRKLKETGVNLSHLDWDGF